jgi:hypothetical protein
MAAQVHALKELLEKRFPSAVPLVWRTAGAIRTGVAELDRALPGGGLPRGRVVGWTPGPGSVALLRSACAAAVGGGERAAWVDGGGTLAAGLENGALLLRPTGRCQALESAEELLRSGGFALVVLCGARAADAERVRLSRAVREGGSTLVALDGEGFLAGVRVSTHIGPTDWRWRLDPWGEPVVPEAVCVHARVRAPGWNREAEFWLRVVSDEPDLSVEPGLGDRRGSD